MSDSSSIAPDGDFDLALVESHGGWWLATWSADQQDWCETSGESRWSEVLTRALKRPRPDRVDFALDGWDERARVLGLAAAAFLSALQARADTGRPYPGTPLAPLGLVAAARTFLDQCVPGQFDLLRQCVPRIPGIRAVPRDPVVLVVPSNVVVAGLDAIQQALLVGCRRILVRLPREGGAVLMDYARHVARASPELGSRLVLLRWPSHAPWPSSLPFAVLSYGGEQARQDLGRQGTIPWNVHHGHQVAVVVGCQPPGEEDLSALAWTTALHEQRGCLSPRLVLMAGLSGGRLAQTAQLLADALGSQDQLPSGMTLVERATVARRRDELWLDLARVGDPPSPGFGLAVSAQAEASVEWHEIPRALPDAATVLARVRRGIGLAQGRHLVLVGHQPDTNRLEAVPVPEVVNVLHQLLDGQPISALGYLESAESWARSIAETWTVHPAGLRPIPWLAPVADLQCPPLIHPLDGRLPLQDLLQLCLEAPPE